ncbi:DUF1987 domain-containing protein [Sporomusa sphaeroides]|uniref:SiaC family regulatory phosphoprotein domain-containing protein n=1 Tax=Sporomusa sphaeroides DSM 2875 TaxID=1337886 RepID=A0ABM9W8J6_9FIRM|nr:DUF1987 domain-containing protein [Sporomusa sphaeroides]OLS57197.1 hypothetical protein SPSPH_07040 [Sporomusa sphaeroides DSM 2875]CVK21479.1 hypothetical protein SSPH_04171 [Sporomusa sphaeroides DSM 2875]
MERLYRAGTKSSPEVDFNPGTGILKVSGQSYPENASGFYQDIFIWLKDYLTANHGRVVMELNISYMNTSSTKCLMDIIYMLEDAFAEGSDICINWYYSAKNRSMLECGEEFREELSMEFNLIPQNSGQ